MNSMQEPQGRNWSKGLVGMLFIGLLLLAYSLCLLLCLGSPAGGGSPAHNELDPLTLIINQESTAQACPQANLVGMFSSFCFNFLFNYFLCLPYHVSTCLWISPISLPHKIKLFKRRKKEKESCSVIESSSCLFIDFHMQAFIPQITALVRVPLSLLCHRW